MNSTKNSLFLYACSHGVLGTVSTDVEQFKAHAWQDEKSWGDLLANNLGFKLVNRSHPGASNFHIFKNILNDIDRNIHNDSNIIVVQWSHISRAYSEKHTLMPHLTDELTKTYYRDLHSDLQNLASLIGYTYYLKNKFKPRFYFSVSDSISLFSEVSASLASDLSSLDNMILLDGETPRQVLVDKSRDVKELLFPCTHASDIGHEYIANIYTNAIADKL